MNNLIIQDSVQNNHLVEWLELMLEQQTLQQLVQAWKASETSAVVKNYHAVNWHLLATHFQANNKKKLAKQCLTIALYLEAQVLVAHKEKTPKELFNTIRILNESKVTLTRTTTYEIRMENFS